MSSLLALRHHSIALALPFTVIWASAFPATKFALLDNPPLAFLAVRFLLAGLLLLAWSLLQGERLRLDWKDWMALLLMAITNHALYLGVNWTGMRELSSGLSAILIGASPIVVALLAVPLLNERLNLRKSVGLVLGFAGMAFIVRHRLGQGEDTLHGTLLVGAALIILSFGTVVFKRLQVNASLSANVGLQMLLAAVLTLPWSWAMEDWSQIQITPNAIGAMLWSVAVVSIGGYLLWFALLRTVDASAASAWLFLTPPLGLLMGWLTLGERLQWHDFLGVVPVVVGIMLVTRPPRTQRVVRCTA